MVVTSQPKRNRRIEMAVAELSASEREALRFRLEVAQAEIAAAEAQMKLRMLGPVEPVVATPVKRTRKPKEAKPPSAKAESPDGIDVSTLNLAPIPDCFNKNLGNECDQLFKVAYRAGSGKVGVYGVAGDEMKTFNKDTNDEETKRMLWLRPLLNDGSRMILMTNKNYNQARGFNVPAHGPARSGGEVLGMVIEAKPAVSEPVATPERVDCPF
jgi:hypothetical protein